MCDIVKSFVDQGKEEIIQNLLESHAGSVEQIAAWVKLPVEEVQEIARKVPVMSQD